jgi:RNA polymerase-interacting CarD/CdnL/TRCF family regulator
MFHTNVYKTESHPDLQIAERRLYENKINLLSTDLGKACTPEQLEKAEAIAEKFRESLVFKYISAENSLINAVVWKSHELSWHTGISFTLNGKPITVTIPADRIVMRAAVSRNAVDDIKDAICQAVAEELTEHVYVEVLEQDCQI